MSFTPVFYVCIACPTIEKTFEMVDKYVEKGATAFQIDMPSADPYAETEFVKKMMKESLAEGYSYNDYMEAIKTIREKYPSLEIHIVVYIDVVESIGVEKFSDFLLEVGAASAMIPGVTPEALKYIEGNGTRVFRSIIHDMSEESIDICAAEDQDAFICLRNKKPGETDREGYETWEKKYAYIRSRGVTGKVYSVFGIKTGRELAAIKATGARGAIIGNVLMHLWDDEEALYKLLGEFVSLAE